MQNNEQLAQEVKVVDDVNYSDENQQFLTRFNLTELDPIELTEPA